MIACLRARRSRTQQAPYWERGRPARNFRKVCFSDWYNRSASSSVIYRLDAPQEV